MATFPVLKTGAVAQYPLERSEAFRTEVVAFLDGSEQRFRSAASPLKRWVIRLDQLDEAETASIEQFFISEQGAAMVFSFTDPMDGTVYTNCSLDSDLLGIEAIQLLRVRTSVVVRQNRGN